MSETGNHLRIWQESVIPLVYYEKLLGEFLRQEGVRVIFGAEGEKYYSTRLFNKMAALSVQLNHTYYSDFLKEDRDPVREMVFDKLGLIWDQLNKQKDDKPLLWEALSFGKVEIYYVAADGNRFYFHYTFLLDANEERAAWIEMWNWVRRYEAQDETTKEMMDRVPSQKDRTWYLDYAKDAHKWSLLNPVLDITLQLSTDYQERNNDWRICKPDILMNEANYLQYFVWDQQWSFAFENLRLIMARPNDIAMYVSLMNQNGTKAKDIYITELKSRSHPFPNPLLKPEETFIFYNYFEHIISAITFSYTALETLANTCIPDGYEYTDEDKKRGIRKIYKKRAIERNFPLRDKLRKILPEILKASDPVKQPWWDRFIRLEDLRNETIHTKPGKSEERYSAFLRQDIFDLINVSKEIIAFYGFYANENVKGVLTDFPYGFNYDNVLPIFMTEEDYNKWRRDLHGIPNPDDDEQTDYSLS